MKENEFYIGQGVFAEIDSQIVRLRKQYTEDRVSFDTGGIHILYHELERIRKESK